MGRKDRRRWAAGVAAPFFLSLKNLISTSLVNKTPINEHIRQFKRSQNPETILQWIVFVEDT